MLKTQTYKEEEKAVASINCSKSTCRNSKIAFRAFHDGEAEMDSMVSTAVGSTAKGIIWEARQAKAMLQSLEG